MKGYDQAEREGWGGVWEGWGVERHAPESKENKPRKYSQKIRMIRCVSFKMTDEKKEKKMRGHGISSINFTPAFSIRPDFFQSPFCWSSMTKR